TFRLPPSSPPFPTRRSSDLNLLARLRIAADARLAVRLDQAAEPRNHEFARCPFGFPDGELKELVKERGGGFLRRSDFLGDVPNNLRLAHWLGHLVCLSS